MPRSPEQIIVLQPGDPPLLEQGRPMEPRIYVVNDGHLRISIADPKDVNQCLATSDAGADAVLGWEMIFAIPERSVVAARLTADVPDTYRPCFIRSCTPTEFQALIRHDPTAAARMIQATARMFAGFRPLHWSDQPPSMDQAEEADTALPHRLHGFTRAMLQQEFSKLEQKLHLMLEIITRALKVLTPYVLTNEDIAGAYDLLLRAAVGADHNADRRRTVSGIQAKTDAAHDDPSERPTPVEPRPAFIAVTNGGKAKAG